MGKLGITITTVLAIVLGIIVWQLANGLLIGIAEFFGISQWIVNVVVALMIIVIFIFGGVSYKKVVERLG